MRDKTRVCCGNAERVQVSETGERPGEKILFMSEQESGTQKKGEGKRQAQRLLCKKAKGPI